MTDYNLIHSKAMAAEAEVAEALCWVDMFEAAPGHVAEALGLVWEKYHNMYLFKSHVPFCHFNNVMNLGLIAVPDEDALNKIAAFYGDKMYWVLTYGSHSEPTNFNQQLKADNYQPSDIWGRVILHGASSENRASWAKFSSDVELVTTDIMEEWQMFIRKCYSMPPLIGDWLKSYVGRRGFIHAILRNPAGEIVMARSLIYTQDKRWGWLGVDAPVPGVMADCYEEDKKVVAALLEAAYEAGVKNFVADVEAQLDEAEGPAYERWTDLGFLLPYSRTLYRRDALEG
jgi:hypothetical protein